MRHERLGLALLHAHDPGAAGHLEQHWRLRIIRQVGALPDIQIIPPSGVAVADISPHPVALADPHVGEQQLPARDRGLRLR